MMKRLQEKNSLCIDEYISLHKKLKAKGARIKKEKFEMEQILKEFKKNRESDGRSVFVKSLDFYLEALKAYDFKMMLAGLEEEINNLKS